jgi:trans-2,3-dihydro-3-hydroxyanthranilate isomerase
MAHRFHIVDVFAEGRFAGNPLAVVRDAGELDAPSMQRIAREFGFSETTFLTSPPESAEPAVRIFTPAEELPFAGHPTLGTAWVIREHLRSARPPALALALGVGRVAVSFEAAPEGGEIVWLTAPPVELARRPDSSRVAAALGLSPGDVASDLPVQEVRAGVHLLLVPLASLAAVRRARLDLAAFAPLAAEGFPRAIYLFAREAEAPGRQLHARMFFEAGGVREDPATGSATACLGAYLRAHGDLGTSLSLQIEQGVEMGRPSLLRLEVTGLPGAANIRVGGRVVEVARGELL